MAAKHQRTITNWLTLTLIFIGVGAGILWITTHDAFLYRQPIASVTKTATGQKQIQSDQFKNRDFSANQTLWLKLLNSDRKGEVVKVQNTFSGSNAQDLNYHNGQQLFVHIQGSGHGRRILLIDLKRDTVTGLLAWLMVFSLILVTGRNGIRPLFSVVTNVILFFVAIKVDIATDADNALMLYCGVAMAFLALTALIIYGKSWKALSVLISSALTIILTLMIAMLVLTVTHGRGLKFETMNYVTQTRMPLYLAETVIGVLGAVMDVCGDIIVSLFTIHENGSKLKRRQIFNNGCQIGRSIMGPLTNILFLIFTSSTLPLMILFLRNGNSLGYSIWMIMSLGIFQSLTSGVGIALASPISSAVASWVLSTKEGSRI